MKMDGHMVLGKNKGHRYEDAIFELLEKAGLLYPGTTHEGMAGGVDAVSCHLGKPQADFRCFAESVTKPLADIVL